MIDRSDLLTWQGLRDLATGEVFNLASGIAIVPPKPGRPPVILESRRMRQGAPAVWMSLPQQIVPQPGAILYARAGWRAPWRREIAQIPVPSVLITAFHDRPITAAATAEMFAPGYVKTWFGVQVATRHPRLVPMPLGVDGRRRPWWERACRQPDHLRDVTLYVNFQATHKRPDVKVMRTAVHAYFADQPWVTVDRWWMGGDAHYYAQLGRSRFVLSPPGYGWECYRTYEAIAMGAIPIVLRKSPLTDVCESLPVLVVEDWREVTPARLQREWESRTPKDVRTLTMTYWRDRIQTAAQESLAS